MNLKGPRGRHPSKKVAGKMERTSKSSFGWTGDAAARDLGVYEKFCPAVTCPIIPVWLLETLLVDFDFKLRQDIKVQI